MCVPDENHPSCLWNCEVLKHLRDSWVKMVSAAVMSSDSVWQKRLCRCILDVPSCCPRTISSPQTARCWNLGTETSHSGIDQEGRFVSRTLWGSDLQLSPRRDSGYPRSPRTSSLLVPEVVSGDGTHPFGTLRGLVDVATTETSDGRPRPAWRDHRRE